MVMLSLPVLISLVAEPLTGLVDTAFVARLGTVPLAALGVGTTALSSAFWIFNFLSIGTQTSVAQALGKQDTKRVAQVISLALALAIMFSVATMLLFSPLLGNLAELLGASDQVKVDAVSYMQVRLFGAPAILIMLVAFGALRGKQDMQTPLWIAVAVNVLNMGLDGVLIFGLGPIPALNVAGAALASILSQWIGAIASLIAIRRSFGFSSEINWHDARALIQVGGDLFVRSGLLILFMMLATRVANEAGAASGAAHQAMAKVFIFTALFLDAFSTSTHSLVGYFIGGNQLDVAKKVVKVGVQWALLTAIALAGTLWLGTSSLIQLLLPPSAEPIALFHTAWIYAIAGLPIGALAYLTDGVHWGTSDYRYLRNCMLLATIIAGGGLLLIDPNTPTSLTWIWVLTLLWNTIRAILGLLRVWPGIGESVWKTGNAG